MIGILYYCQERVIQIKCAYDSLLATDIIYTILAEDTQPHGCKIATRVLRSLRTSQSTPLQKPRLGVRTEY